MPAEIKEIVLNTHCAQSQDFLPHVRNGLFEVISRRTLPRWFRSGSRHFRQRFAVNFSACGHGKRIEKHPGGGHHIVRQPLTEKTAQTRSVEGFGCFGHHIPDQARIVC